MNINDLLEDAIYSNPLVLLTIKDQSMIDTINNYLPYSIGIEIECNQSFSFDITQFQKIPDILDVNVDSSEQRFRIPNGLSGLICLYTICEELKLNSELNPDSGHHYHIDMTNTYHLLTKEFISVNEDWMLKELDTWGYKGNYNKRRIAFDSSSNWMRFQSGFKTAEIRIGNMTFDYKTIITRLIHACRIIQKLNSRLSITEEITYTKPTITDLSYMYKYNKNDNRLKNLYIELSKLNKQSLQSSNTNSERKQIINRRVIKI